MTAAVDFRPQIPHAGAVSIQRVAVVVQDGAEPFALGSLCEVWAEPYHPEDDNPVFDFVVCTPRPGRVRGASGFDLYVDHGLEALDGADLVCVVPKRDYTAPAPDVAAALREAHDAGAIIFAHCTGAFALGEAGLLDDRRCTTHWRHVDELVSRYPRARVDADVLYVQDGRVLTGAGSSAGIDAALHLLRTTFGSRVATATARRMVVTPHRDGGQAQFIKAPVPECDADALAPLLAWIAEHLEEDLSVEALARRALMSPRTFARRFRQETGTTPHAWIVHQRVQAAEQLLEETSLGVDQIAARVGFSNAAALRHHFTRLRRVSPQQYRRRFSCVPEPVGVAG
jgi:transcriptional regulator GlxA family with amidase domain